MYKIKKRNENRKDKPGISNTQQERNKLYHYTVFQWYGQIVSDGYIKPAYEHIPENERKVVWLSTNPVWEETANKNMDENGRLIQLDKKGTHALGGGLVRIEVPFDLTVGWDEFLRTSGIEKQRADGLVRAAKKKGSMPSDWRVSFETIYVKDWIGVEFFDWDKQTWVPYDEL